jgi:hypothetical protein
MKRIKGEPKLAREDNGGVVSIDNSSLRAYKNRKAKSKEVENDISNLKSDITNIKDMLTQIIKEIKK